MVVHGIEVVIEVGCVVEHTLWIHIARNRSATVVIRVNVIIHQIRNLIGEEITIRIGVPLEEIVIDAHIGDPEVTIVSDLIVSYGCCRPYVVGDEIEPEAILVAGPLSLRVAAIVGTFVKFGVGSGAIWRCIDCLLSLSGSL